MGITDTEVKDIIRRITEAARVDRIILFGSAASGQMTKDSDIDLLVLQKEPSNTRIESIRLRRALKEIPFPFDVIVMSTDRFEESKSVIGGIAFPAHKYGKVIYEAA